MEQLTVHDLTAAYALDALEADEVRDYEEHLATCERCRAELSQLGGAASALAFAVESPAPPPALRERILESARAERPNVVPLRPRWTGVTRAVAAVAAIAAIGFGIWAASLSRSLDSERSARAQAEKALTVLSDTDARRVELARATLVVSRSGDAALIVNKLAPAPRGKTYEAWVIENGKPLRAGTFSGGGAGAVGLERRLMPGASVAVTLEDEPGGDVPRGPFVVRPQTV